MPTTLLAIAYIAKSAQSEKLNPIISEVMPNIILAVNVTVARNKWPF